MDSSNNYPQPTWSLQGIDSSNISAIAYTAGGEGFGTMTVRFCSGVEYDYSNVSVQLADDFFAAESKGSFFHRNIRNKFIGVKREEVPEEPTEDRFDRQRDAEREATGKLESEETADDGEIF